ncbi:MAG: TIGR03564 family F420-dependent LLM class oxidoreductase, partial [Pseudomonadales bacterium]|nr:TIGR03564 family F420-dependent LLM class oxidoreductase [Pseudomonadales bacterium]
MKIGINSGAASGPETTFPGLIARAQQMEAHGFDCFWMANMFGLDAMTALAVVGQQTSTIQLGTAVVPSYPRHPLIMAQQAATTNVASNGRFHLGLGLSHKPIIEGMLGMSYDKPAKHMREYLSILTPAAKNEKVSFSGDQYTARGRITVTDSKPVPILVAALGDIMLKLAATMADGTITWMTGLKTLEDHIIPKIRKAAAEAGRPEPRIVAGVPTAIIPASDKQASIERIEKGMKMYGQLDSYRSMLDKEGVAGPSGVANIGEEAELRKYIQRLRDIGVT